MKEYTFSLTEEELARVAIAIREERDAMIGRWRLYGGEYWQAQADLDQRILEKLGAVKNG